MFRFCFLVPLLCVGYLCAAQQSVDLKYDPGIVNYDNGDYYDTRGWHYGFAMGFGLDDFSSDTTKHLSAVHIEAYGGWKFNSRFSIASGFGFEFNESRLAGFRFDTQFATLHLRTRYNILTTRWMPFITGRVGYGFGPPQEEDIVDHENGINYQVAVGVHIPSNRKYKYSIALAWHHQVAMGRESFIDPFGNEINTQYDLLINRLVLKLGMDFN